MISDTSIYNSIPPWGENIKVDISLNVPVIICPFLPSCCCNYFIGLFSLQSRSLTVTLKYVSNTWLILQEHSWTFIPVKLIKFRVNRRRERRWVWGGRGGSARQSCACLSGFPDNTISHTLPFLPRSLNSITRAKIKYPNDTQHHRICKRRRQKHKFNVAALCCI